MLFMMTKASTELTHTKFMAKTVAELVFLPATGVGHIMSIIEMAKVFISRDQRLSVTVLIIKPTHSPFAVTAYIESLAKNAIERVRFIELPQNETPPTFDPKTPMTSLYGFYTSHCKYVRNAVGDMMKRPGFGQLVGFVMDIFCTGMIDVANEFDVPTYVYYTSNAAFFGFNLYIETLCVDQNQDVIKLSNSEGEILVPSFAKPLPTKVFPELYQTQEGLEFLMCAVRKLKEVKAIMVNTFLELETHAIKLFSDTNFPSVYPVGPVLNLGGIAGKAEDIDVISWLDGQPPSSVVFLCFGSMGSFDEVQVKEIAYALERSGHRFVWSLRRPPLPKQSFEFLPDDYSDPGVVLPDGFLERTAGIGKVIGWAPQVALLAHQATGGFVSHCGWNSILESLWFGVPVATWPMYSEQQMNAFGMVEELGLAIEIKMDYKNNAFNQEGNMVIVSAQEIERGIRRLMEDDEVRAKVKEMSKMSRATVTEGGSSYASVGCLVQDFMSNIT